MAEDSAGAATGRTHFILIPHTHWDREWYLPQEVFRQRLVRLLDRLQDLLEADPSYQSFHLDGQTIPLLDYEQIRGRSERLRRLIREGRIRIGPWYVLPDEFLVGGEALIRNLERGFLVAAEFGAEPVRLGYLPDMFGHVAHAPQLLRGFGLERAVVWRGVTPDVEGQTFVWESPDGSRVDTVFLPIGYGYGSNLPRNPELLAQRLEGIARQISGDQPERLIGILNGSDHVEPRAEVPADLDAAVALRPGFSWEFGDMETLVGRLLAAEPPRSHHRGELRSPCRTLILPSVASARLYLKKLDFDHSAKLERRAEPIAALARALGGPDLLGFLDYAWGLLLENHPHDSICGCSIDAVHDEMETRYAKVGQVLDRVISESMDTIVRRLAKEGPSLIVHNPAGGRKEAAICGEVEGRLRHALALSGPDGEERPLQVLETVEPEVILTDQRLPREAGLMLLGELVAPELFGMYLQGAKIAVAGDTLDVRLDVGDAPSGVDVAALRAAVEKAALDPRVRMVRAKVSKLPRLRVAAIAPALSGCAVESFALVRRTGRREEVEVGHSHMENDRLRLQFEPGGTCLLYDKASGLGYRCLRFLDVGDRGDTYNFDPLPDEHPKCEPEKVALKLIGAGPAAAVMEIRHRFRIPESLNANRQARSKKSTPLDLTTRVCLFKDSRQVVFRTAFTNPARDHRLQVGLRAPFEADVIHVESAFGVVERPIQAAGLPREACATDLAATLLGREGTYSTSPQKTLAFIGRGDFGIAVMNRGMAEVDAIKLDGATRVAMTMVRSVGWLSRPDLAMRPGEAGPTLATPGAQCLRRFVWEYAVEPFRQDESDDLLASAHAFAYPPALSLAHAPALSLVHERAGRREKVLQLVAIDNPRVWLSAVRPLADGGLEVRLVNGSSREETCRVTFADRWTRPRVVDFLGRPSARAAAKASPHAVEATLRTQEILTVRLDARK